MEAYEMSSISKLILNISNLFYAGRMFFEQYEIFGLSPMNMMETRADSKSNS